MILLLIFFLCRQAFVQSARLDSISGLDQLEALAEKGSWKVAKNKKGIVLNCRKLKVAETSKILELTASFTISSSVDRIIEHLKQPQRIQQWNEAVLHSELIEDRGSIWISHTTFNVPSPFPPQELISRHEVNQTADEVIINTRPVPNHRDPEEGVLREKYNWSGWSLRPSDNGTVHITFTVASLSICGIPRFIKDPIIKRKYINSFVKLKNQLENCQS
ncbi:hypothetical protein [Flagellimonas algicola]|uniref:START domain-containing protein n=1 Tax=Flagellimonas algicola TaxID=2583815 RepID=A0ABY2WGL7_9FLAO|nr:hypothetical protein [Allomuricauda algicola]TMU50693.1 hypothetical protein FGG15_17995 [Allomuricauda algicola]